MATVCTQRWMPVVAQLERVLKGRGSSRALSAAKSSWLYCLRKNSLPLVLGGAAVHRRDNCIVLNRGFSR